MRATIRSLGNSSGVILPKPFLAELEVVAGDVVDLSLEAGRIVVTPIRRAPREGWGDAAAAIAAAEDDAPLWPEFGNQDDAGLIW